MVAAERGKVSRRTHVGREVDGVCEPWKAAVTGALLSGTTVVPPETLRRTSMSTTDTPIVSPYPLAYRPVDAAPMVGLSKTKLYELMASGALPSLKVGKRRLIRHVDLVALMDRLYAEAWGSDVAHQGTGE